jgi:hypothetical protein
MHGIHEGNHRIAEDAEVRHGTGYVQRRVAGGNLHGQGGGKMSTGREPEDTHPRGINIQSMTPVADPDHGLLGCGQRRRMPMRRHWIPEHERVDPQRGEPFGHGLGFMVCRFRVASAGQNQDCWRRHIGRPDGGNRRERPGRRHIGRPDGGSHRERAGRLSFRLRRRAVIPGIPPGFQCCDGA